MKTKTMRYIELLRPKNLVRQLFYIIVVALYCASIITVVIGIGVLTLILVYGWINIRDGQLLSLGILMFLPLHYLKKYLERKGFNSFIEI